VGFNDFTDALKSLQQVGLVTLTGASGQEKVALTPAGQQVVKLQVKP
jgi:hypothetical protein